MRQGWRHLQAYLRFLALPQFRRNLVVYSEGANSWPHLGPVLQAVLNGTDRYITYVSSSADDPGVAIIHPQLSAYVIGDGLLRTLFFSGLQADLLLMTMPDLNTFHIKRSARTGQYAYLHHSLVSSHMAYRDAAFDYFDTILCAGPHHVDEIRAIIGCDALIYQDVEGMKKAVLKAAAAGPDGRFSVLAGFDASCFDGQYVTGDITAADILRLNENRVGAVEGEEDNSRLALPNAEAA